MKRVGGLWDTLVSFANLHEAARRAALGKKRRPDVAAFLLEQENELACLQRELLDGSYQPGPYHQFTVKEPKPRLISAAPFRDRVVHHAVTQVLEPIFERRFSRDSFACRTGFGSHRALKQAARAAARFRFVLKCDVRKYFASIDHEILNGLLARVVKCRPTLDLARRIISCSGPQENVAAYFPGDNLFTPYERRRGLPLGNQTSQFFANVYLDSLDQMMNRQLRPGCYVRYVDDFVVFAEGKGELAVARKRIEDCLAGLRLSIHPAKSRVYRCAEGVTFLGWRLFPDRIRLVRPNVVDFRRRMRGMQRGFAGGRFNWEQVTTRVQAWIGHAAHGNTWRLRERLFEQFAFVAGSAVVSAGRRLEQQSEEPPFRVSQQQRT